MNTRPIRMQKRPIHGDFSGSAIPGRGNDIGFRRSLTEAVGVPGRGQRQFLAGTVGPVHDQGEGPGIVSDPEMQGQDGAVEMVLEGNKAGNAPPVNTYSVFLTQQNEITPGQKMQYYVDGNFYQSWEKIPQEYKVPKMKDEDLSKIGLIDFRF